MTAPRIIVPGATTAITRRTTLRKAFLAPWHPLVPRIWLYALAYAQAKTGVAVHHGTCVINHHHLTVTPETDNLPEFTQGFHHDLSCALNTLLAQERYDTPRELFDARKPHCMRLLDAPAQAAQIVYEYNNVVAAGLVHRPEHMPGYWFDFDLWKTEYLEVERPDVFFGDDRPKLLRLQVTPPPLLFEAFGGDLDRLVYHMRKVTESAGRTLRAARRRPPLGAQRITRLHPWSEPRTLRETGGQRVPTFRLGARGIAGIQLGSTAATETHEFRREHEEARLQWCAGCRDQPFPYGTYAMRRRHGARVLEPKPGAFVTQPGPLLCDIIERLKTQAPPRDVVHEQMVDLLGEVEQAFGQDAAEICQQEDVDFEREAPEPRGGADAAAEARPDVRVRHRFDPPLSDAAAATARRIIVLRDRRRGRPPGSGVRHGADPPG